METQREETGMEIVEERGRERKGREGRVRETEWKREREKQRGEGGTVNA